MQLILLWKKQFKKTAEATNDLIGKKITNKITKNSLQKKSENDSQTEGKKKNHICIHNKCIHNNIITEYQKIIC